MLIKADAIGVNFIDTYFRSGMYPHALPFVPGSEVCGVAAVGDGVSTVQVGDRRQAWRHRAGARWCRRGAPHAFRCRQWAGSTGRPAAPQRRGIGVSDPTAAD